jgi:hypothetical protein
VFIQICDSALSEVIRVITPLLNDEGILKGKAGTSPSSSGKSNTVVRQVSSFTLFIWIVVDLAFLLVCLGFLCISYLYSLVSLVC